jgi:hypothetical protein
MITIKNQSYPKHQRLDDLDKFEFVSFYRIESFV